MHSRIRRNCGYALFAAGVIHILDFKNSTNIKAHIKILSTSLFNNTSQISMYY